MPGTQITMDILDIQVVLLLLTMLGHQVDDPLAQPEPEVEFDQRVQW